MQKKDDIVKIYDDMFNLIGAEKWSVVHARGLLHQVVHLWMYGDEPDGRWLYFIQRSKDLDVFPAFMTFLSADTSTRKKPFLMPLSHLPGNDSA